MVEQEDGGQFTAECSFMDDVLEDMQLIGLKQVDVDIKFLAIAGFCITYGVCCITTNQNVLAKEIIQKAIFLIKSLYGNEVNHIQILTLYRPTHQICHVSNLCVARNDLQFPRNSASSSVFVTFQIIFYLWLL